MTTSRTSQGQEQDVPPPTVPGGNAGPGSHNDPKASIKAPPDSRQLHRRVAFALALVFFFTPLAAYAFGVRATAFENHSLAKFPGLSSGWHLFAGLNTWAIDHMPLRQQAVAGNASLSEGVFKEPPQYGGPAGDQFAAGVTGKLDTGASGTSGSGAAGSGAAGSDANQGDYPRVFAGKDGWLYFGGDIAGPCTQTVPFRQNLTAVDRLAKIIQKSGRTFVFAVAPDKSTMVPQELPADFLGKSCMEQGKQRFWAELRSNPPTGSVGLRAALEAQQRRTGSTLYRHLDSHWDQRAAATYAEQIVKRIDPGLLETTTVQPTGPVQVSGDLSVIAGQPRKETIAGYAVVRPGVTAQSTGGVLIASTTGAPVFQPDVLILGDSFTDNARAALAPFFAHATITQPAEAGASPGGLIGQIRSSKVVVYEVVERTVDGGQIPLLDPAFLDRLSQALKPAG